MISRNNIINVNDIDWVTKFLESKLSLEFVEKVTPMLKELGDNVKPKDIAKAIINYLLKIRINLSRDKL